MQSMYLIDRKISSLCDKLSEMKEKKLCDLEDFLYCETGYKYTNEMPEPGTMQQYSKYSLLDGSNRHYWFYTKIPSQKQSEGQRLYFRLTAGSQGMRELFNPQCIVFVNGKMIQAFDKNHKDLLLDFEKEYEIYIHMYTEESAEKIFFDAKLFLIDVKIEKLYYDLHVPYEAALCLKETDENRITILKQLELALGYLDLRVPFSKEFYDSIDQVTDYLYQNFYHGVCGKSDAVVSCVGHTHIDVAWLWVLEQTKQKAQRSFSTVIELMKQFPEFKFMSSQPQLYEYVKEYAPEVYAEIKKKVEQGNWEPEGAMWLEADCNLTGGESLIRQILFGKRFMQEEFGVDNACVWLPDVFGFSASLPQILKKCGIDKFITSKLSWNDYNIFPYDSFMWEGIDGSQIFAYFITTQDATTFNDGKGMTKYNGYINPGQVLGTWLRYQQKELNQETLLPFGFGDGGGGPTKDMLEQQRRLSYGIPGFPRTQIDTSANILNRVYKNFCENTSLLKRTPKWVGELYFEKHRGTYTSIAKNKKNNRKSELLYQALESLSVLATILTGDAYEQEAINKGWKSILLNQFHDILPGSSIHPVYEQTDRDYAEILNNGTRMLTEKLNHILKRVKTEGGIFVYNPNGFECSDIVEVEGNKVFVEKIPACGYRVVMPKAQKSSVKVTPSTMENNFYKLTFDDCYQIISLYDKCNDREIVKETEHLGELQLFEDYPGYFDAWDLDHSYKQKMWVIDTVSKAEIVDEGVRKGVRITRDYLNSQIIQTIYLYDDINRIDFENHIDWKEEHLLLKAAFPINVHANEATYDIQFGNIKRPTYENTSWDEARFEVCAHKWADISEDGYGVSLINDCKYGHSAEGSALKLSLLKCATYPDPEADKELHTFRFALIPHAGSFKEAGIEQAAQQFNQPMVARFMEKQDGELTDCYSFISCKNENIMIDTIKKAESSDHIIVRLHEFFDRKTKAEIVLGVAAEKVYLCDMLEDNLEELCLEENKVYLNVSNYEIVTLKIVLKN